MKNKLSVLSLLLITILFVWNCSSGANTEKSTMQGLVIMTGHEPFAALSLQVSDSEVYKLELPDELKSQLMDNQGEVYKVEYSQIKEELKHKVLVVTSIEKIKTRD